MQKEIILSLFLFLCVFSQDSITAFPKWFFETPESCIVVVAKDNATKRGRAIAIYKEANRILRLENSPIRCEGDNGFDIQSNSIQKDRFKLNYTFIEANSINYLIESNFTLLDYERFEGKFLLALFGKASTSFSSERKKLSEKPDWVENSKNTSSYSIGFGSDNVYYYSNRILAFKHSLFNLSQNNNTKSYRSFDLNKTNSEKNYKRLNVNFVSAEFNGVRIEKQWISQDNVWYILLKKL